MSIISPEREPARAGAPATGGPAVRPENSRSGFRQFVFPQERTLPRLWLQSIIAYGVVPNALFLALSPFVYMMRPFVNADYFLIGAVAPFVPGWLAVAGYALVLANELFVNLAPLYHFQIVDAIRWLGELRYVGWRVWVPSLVGLLTLSLVIAALATRFSSHRRLRRLPIFSRLKLAVGMLSLCFLVCAADIVNGTSFIPIPWNFSFVDANLAYSGVRRSLMSMLTLYESKATIRYAPLDADHSAAGPLLAEIRGGALHAKPQIALIVVESMGLFQDPDVARRLLDPLTSPELAKRYRVRTEAIPFNGHTIEAEFRELCGVQLQAYGEQGFPKCMPAYLNEQGYETTGLHGFTNQFYNRYRWYPKLGFDRIFFAEEMQGMGASQHCGSGFTGICDESVAELLHQQLLQPGKPQFVYWMTLNSHLPLDTQSAVDSNFDCNASPLTRSAQGPCLHSRMVHLVLEKLAQVAADPKLPPTKFIIVGDHMPPFMKPEIRALYSPTDVPAIILEPLPTNGRASHG